MGRATARTSRSVAHDFVERSPFDLRIKSRQRDDKVVFDSTADVSA
jgi:hypothetical protein